MVMAANLSAFFSNPFAEFDGAQQSDGGLLRFQDILIEECLYLLSTYGKLHYRAICRRLLEDS